jgi:signal transduction histidine kinase
MSSSDDRGAPVARALDRALGRILDRVLDGTVSPRLVVPSGLAATLLIALGDYATGAEVAFTLLYMIPIAWATWRAGLSRGLAVAGAASACSFIVALLSPGAYGVQVTLWNEGSVLVIFFGLAVLTGRQRESVLRERRDKQRIVNQLRHADRLNVIGTLAAGVAHEIGTPLNVISGSAELLRGASPADVDELAGVIYEQTSRISSIIRHLLDFGRRGGTKAAAVDLNELARAGTRLLAPIAKKRAVQLRVAPAPAPVVVCGNAAELEQVLSNLVLNAIQAMPLSGGTISIEVGHASRAGGRGDRPLGTFSIEDTGVGIPARDLPRIFDPFFTTKGVGEGTGLGLSVSYGIVQDHGGEIEVDSEVGRGTRFTVLLPLAAEAGAQAARGAASASAAAVVGPDDRDDRGDDDRDRDRDRDHVLAARDVGRDPVHAR